MGSCNDKEATAQSRAKQPGTTKQHETVLQPAQFRAQAQLEREGCLSLAPGEPLPVNPLSTTNPSDLNISLSYTGSLQTLGGSLTHISAYEHVHHVEPPSELEDSGKIAGLQDSTKIWQLVNPEVQLYDSYLRMKAYNEGYVGSLQLIREQMDANVLKQ